MAKPVFKLTKVGFEKLKEELEELINKRPQVLTRMVAAREQGDLSENAGFHAAKEELGRIDHRIREVKQMIKFAQIIEPISDGIVNLGSSVVVDDGNGRAEFMIVSKLEASPMQGKMSDESPIGMMLLGKKAGDVLEIMVPSGKVVYKILEVK